MPQNKELPLPWPAGTPVVYFFSRVTHRAIGQIVILVTVVTTGNNMAPALDPITLNYRIESATKIASMVAKSAKSMWLLKGPSTVSRLSHRLR